MFKTRSFYILGLGILFKDSGLQFVLGLYKVINVFTILYVDKYTSIQITTLIY